MTPEKDAARLAEIDRQMHALRSERGQIVARNNRRATRAIQRAQVERRKALVPNPVPFNERAERDMESESA